MLAMVLFLAGSPFSSGAAERPVLRVLSFFSPFTLDAAAKVHAFERAADCWVEWEFRHQFELLDLVRERLHDFDVVTIDEPWLPGLHEEILPVADWDSAPYRDAHEDRFLDEVSHGLSIWKGKSYGVVILKNLYLYVYRADVLYDPYRAGKYEEQLGFPFQPPERADRFIRLSRLLSREDPAGGLASVTFPGEGLLVNLFWAFWSVGIDLSNTDNWENLTTGEMSTGLSRFSELIHLMADGSKDGGELFLEDVNLAYVRGRVAQVMQWSDLTGSLVNPLFSQIDTGTAFALLPGDESGGAFSITGFWYLCIPRGSEQRELANRFINWWLAGARPRVPDHLLEVYRAAEGRTWSRPRLHDYTLFSDHLTQLLIGFVNGEQSLLTTARQMRDLLKDWNPESRKAHENDF